MPVVPPPAVTAPAAAAPVQVVNRFSFRLHAPMDKAAPLFGAQAERAWAGADWQPTFLFPQPPADVEGAVFTVPHGTRTATWVNTRFDLTNGRMDYVYVIPEVMTAAIAVALRPVAADETIVEVTYRRTALDPQANDAVVAMGARDAASGPEWKAQIERSWAKGQR
ncbi:hypothetical protein [Sphingomonas sp.]|uniref:hypothetical protein n=1 Tax=Sphingomonas sp. TaxID=28214 RepID=UPI003B3B5E13